MVPTTPPAWTIQRAYDEVYAHVWKGSKGCAKALINARQALAFFGPDTPTSAIDSSRVAEYMQHLDGVLHNSGSTKNKKLSALSMMLRRASKYGGLAALPILDRYSEKDSSRVSWYSAADEALMLGACEFLGLTTLREFIVIALDTGFRRSELLGLRMVDYQGGLLMLHAGRTKSGKARSVPCTARTKAILDARPQVADAQVFPGYTDAVLRGHWGILRHHLGKDDDPDFIIHVLRHTCATRLVQRGAHLRDVQLWMGHSTIEMTLEYAHHAAGQLNGALACLEAA